MKYGGLVKSLPQPLCYISSIVMVIQSTSRCSSISLYCLLNGKEVKYFILLKSAEDEQFYRLLTEGSTMRIGVLISVNEVGTLGM